MSIELPRQPTGGSRRCYKCAVRFPVTRDNRHARQCDPCRVESAQAKATRVRVHERTDGHTHHWDRRSLGLFEAATLRMVWGREQSSSVTGNSE